MNCKPGDLAVIVRATIPEYLVNVGRIVRVVRPYVQGEVLPGHAFDYMEQPGMRWVVMAEGKPLRVNPQRPDYSVWHCCFDDSLRPIRDPGDNAKDETLSWKPVPHKELIPLKVRGEVRAE